MEHEVFMCLHLDNKNQLITFEGLFKGIVDQVIASTLVKLQCNHSKIMPLQLLQVTTILREILIQVNLTKI